MTSSRPGRPLRLARTAWRAFNGTLRMPLDGRAAKSAATTSWRKSTRRHRRTTPWLRARSPCLRSCAAGRWLSARACLRWSRRALLDPPPLAAFASSSVTASSMVSASGSLPLAQTGSLLAVLEVRARSDPDRARPASCPSGVLRAPSAPSAPGAVFFAASCEQRDGAVHADGQHVVFGPQAHEAVVLDVGPVAIDADLDRLAGLGMPPELARQRRAACSAVARSSWSGDRFGGSDERLTSSPAPRWT